MAFPQGVGLERNALQVTAGAAVRGELVIVLVQGPEGVEYNQGSPPSLLHTGREVCRKDTNLFAVGRYLAMGRQFSFAHRSSEDRDVRFH